MSTEIGQVVVKCRACFEGVNDPACPKCAHEGRRIVRAFHLTEKLDACVKFFMHSTVELEEKRPKSVEAREEGDIT